MASNPPLPSLAWYDSNVCRATLQPQNIFSLSNSRMQVFHAPRLSILVLTHDSASAAKTLKAFTATRSTHISAATRVSHHSTEHVKNGSTTIDANPTDHGGVCSPTCTPPTLYSSAIFLLLLPPPSTYRLHLSKKVETVSFSGCKSVSSSSFSLLINLFWEYYIQEHRLRSTPNERRWMDDQ